MGSFELERVVDLSSVANSFATALVDLNSFYHAHTENDNYQSLNNNVINAGESSDIIRRENLEFEDYSFCVPDVSTITVTMSQDLPFLLPEAAAEDSSVAFLYENQGILEEATVFLPSLPFLSDSYQLTPENLLNDIVPSLTLVDLENKNLTEDINLSDIHKDAGTGYAQGGESIPLDNLENLVKKGGSVSTGTSSLSNDSETSHQTFNTDNSSPDTVNETNDTSQGAQDNNPGTEDEWGNSATNNYVGAGNQNPNPNQGHLHGKTQSSGQGHNQDAGQGKGQGQDLNHPSESSGNSNSANDPGPNSNITDNSGSDVLHGDSGGTGSPQIDFQGEVNLEHMAHLEVINMQNNLPNILEFTAQDVANESASGNKLIIQGDPQDTVILDTGGWILEGHGQGQGSGHNHYDTYVSSDNGVLVQIESIAQVVVNDPG